jgi:hypothetical protein
MSKQLLHRPSLLQKLRNFMGIMGLGSAIAFFSLPLPAFSEIYPAYRAHRQIHKTTIRRTRTTPGLREFDPAGRATNNISGSVTYPYGSRLYTNGTVQTPNGQVVAPAVTVNHGNGSTTYFYPDGSHVDTNGSSILPTGTLIR